ncbi:hypothetical protein CF319_g4847 [Tilletia indica]|nr:hypothetical protein CF319_g4847 [Tilletia indica]
MLLASFSSVTLLCLPILRRSARVLFARPSCRSLYPARLFTTLRPGRAAFVSLVIRPALAAPLIGPYYPSHCSRCALAALPAQSLSFVLLSSFRPVPLLSPALAVLLSPPPCSSPSCGALLALASRAGLVVGRSVLLHLVHSLAPSERSRSTRTQHAARNTPPPPSRTRSSRLIVSSVPASASQTQQPLPPAAGTRMCSSYMSDVSDLESVARSRQSDRSSISQDESGESRVDSEVNNDTDIDTDASNPSETQMDSLFGPQHILVANYATVAGSTKYQFSFGVASHPRATKKGSRQGVKNDYTSHDQKVADCVQLYWVGHPGDSPRDISARLFSVDFVPGLRKTDLATLRRENAVVFRHHFECKGTCNAPPKNGKDELDDEDDAIETGKASMGKKHRVAECHGDVKIMMSSSSCMSVS